MKVTKDQMRKILTLLEKEKILEIEEMKEQGEAKAQEKQANQ